MPPSLRAAGRPTIPRPETGSAHHRPNRALRAKPTKATDDRYQHAYVCWASAIRARATERLPGPALRARQPQHHHDRDGSETDADGPRIRRLGGDQRPDRFEGDVRRQDRKLAPTSRSARRSMRSTPSGSCLPLRSPARRQIRTPPEMLSTKLSAPKPMSAGLAASTPALIATMPSTMFQPTVTYSEQQAAVQQLPAAPWRSMRSCGPGALGGSSLAGMAQAVGEDVADALIRQAVRPPSGRAWSGRRHRGLAAAVADGSGPTG